MIENRSEPSRSARAVTRKHLAAACLAGALGSLAGAGSGQPEFELLGYNDLVARLGDQTPTGAGIVSATVEPPDDRGNYGPNQNGGHFFKKTFIEMDGPTFTSDHAHVVAGYQYGTANSVAPDVDVILLYNTLSWISSGFLHTGEGGAVRPEPFPEAVKTMNHSWIGMSSQSNDNDALRRTDWMVTRDDVLVSVGVNNNGGASMPLLSHMYNGMAVGIRDGSHQSANTMNGYDGPGRMKPELVAPANFSSFATPKVNATASLLTETARTWDGLSDNPAAERTEVLKAAIMASAVHEDLHDSEWSNAPDESGPFRGYTDTPLDQVVGAGTLQVDRAHRVLTGLEQDGTIGVPTSQTIEWAGWDLASIGVGESRFYRYHLPAIATEASILITWHRQVRGNFSGFWLADFDLRLWRVDATGALIDLVGNPGVYLGGNVASESAIDNVEHLHVTGLDAGQYVIEVIRRDSLTQPSPEWDVAVAWIFPEPMALPEDLDRSGFVDFNDLVLLLSAWGDCTACEADLNGDGAVDFQDLIQLLAAWSA